MRIVTLLVVLLLLSGCSQLFEQSSGETNIPTTDRPDRTTTATDDSDQLGPTEPTREEGESTSSDATPSTATTDTTFSPDNIDTERMQVSLSELPDEFSVVGDTLDRREQATGETYVRMEERGVQLLHERAFSGEGDTRTAYVFASVAVYDAEADAAGWLQTHLEQIDENGGTVQTRDVTQSETATAVRFQNDRGLRTVGLYQRHSNVVFYVAVSGDEYDDEMVERLFVTMRNDFDAE
ncbi:hypothetical protein [Haloarcula marina]|uniref:hypothetical protein n=1 Tax=Haloarcula marina TaxID=2961574 RepID=UPI0020B88C5A|nr:hypothetical protein [Halomicroarcula marina]